MSDLVGDILSEIAENIEIIEKRFTKINTANDFVKDEDGMILLDAIAIRLMAIGENVYKIQKLNAPLLQQYTSVEWDDVIRFRNFIAHHYEMMDYEVVYSICKNDLRVMSSTIMKMLNDFTE